MTFAKWFDVFLEEKDIDQEEVLDINVGNDFHIIPIKIITDFIKTLDKETQRTIKQTFVEIDFKNGNVKHFLKHIFRATQL